MIEDEINQTTKSIREREIERRTLMNICRNILVSFNIYEPEHKSASEGKVYIKARST